MPSRREQNGRHIDARANGRTHPVESKGSPDEQIAAFERAVQASSRTLWSIAAAVLGRRSDAEDVVQDAVVVALGKKDEFSRVENFTAWMAQIVRFVALNRRRAAKLRSAEGEDSLQHVPGHVHGRDEGAVTPHGRSVVDSSGRLVDAEAAFDDRVTHALAGLEETQRACFLLRVVNDLSYQEIGAALSIPEGTAMSHVFRARRTLLERLAGSTQSPPPNRPRPA